MGFCWQEIDKTLDLGYIRVAGLHRGCKPAVRYFYIRGQPCFAITQDNDLNFRRCKLLRMASNPVANTTIINPHGNYSTYGSMHTV